MDLAFIRNSFRLRRIKGFIKSGFGMGIQIIYHEANLLYMGIMLINQFFDTQNWLVCVALSCRCFALTPCPQPCLLNAISLVRHDGLWQALCEPKQAPGLAHSMIAAVLMA
jgi:hypothetical protein